MTPFTLDFEKINKTQDRFIHEIDQNFAKLARNVDNLRKQRLPRTSTQNHELDLERMMNEFSGIHDSKF